MVGRKVGSKNGIPNGWRPDKGIFVEECKNFKIKELAEKYGCCIDTICHWRGIYGVSDGLLKPKEITWIVKGDCWICTSHKPGSTGYPSMRIKGTPNVSILKLKYEEKYGKIPKGKCMLHKCDNRSCINPDHVVLGSKGDNCRDRHAKKRDCFGERSPEHKLKKEDIIFARELRLTGYFYYQIAEYFDVHTTTICDALTGRSWVQAFGGEKNNRCYRSREW
jgi:hypothetical protein